MDGKKLKENFPEIADAIIKEAEYAYNGMLILPGTMGKRFFVGIPADWTANPVNDKEYVYSLNRMGNLKTMAEAYTITGDCKYKNRVLAELQRWVDTVLPPSVDDTAAFSECSPWRALEIGSRGYSSWPAIIDAIPESRDILRDSAAKHMEIIYAVSPKLWPKANHNHYLIENLGLLSLSAIFPELDPDGKYMAHASRELDRCLRAQISAEGAQIEGCPSYHNACLSLFALRYSIMNEPISKDLERMYRHSVYSSMNTGGNFQIGDSHGGDKETIMLPSVSIYLATGYREYLSTALHFDSKEMLMKEAAAAIHRVKDYGKLKEDIEWAISSENRISLPLCAFQKSIGEGFIRTGWNRNDTSIAMIARSPIQNNHAHIDPCSFIMTALGKPMILDPGIYTYREGNDRYRYKSTRSHSTVSINRKDAWEYISSWKYGPQKHSYIKDIMEYEYFSKAEMVCECYGNAIISRTLVLLRNGSLILFDRVSGTGKGDIIEISFNLNSIKTVIEKNTIHSDDEGADIKLQFSMGTIKSEDGFYSPVNDIEVNTTIARNTIISDGNEIIATAIITPYTGKVPIDAEIAEDNNRITIKADRTVLIYEKGEITYKC